MRRYTPVLRRARHMTRARAMANTSTLSSGSSPISNPQPPPADPPAAGGTSMARTPAGAMTAWRGPGSMTATSEGPWAGCRFFSRRRASARCATEAARAASSRVENPRKLARFRRLDRSPVRPATAGRQVRRQHVVLASLPPRTGARATRRPRRVTTRTSTISRVGNEYSIRVRMKSFRRDSEAAFIRSRTASCGHPALLATAFLSKTASSPTDPPSSGSTCRRCRAPGRRKRSGRSRVPGR